MNKLLYSWEMARKATSLKIVPKSLNYLKYRFDKQKPVVKRYTPQIVGLMTTQKCNLRCGYCGFAREGILEGKSEMTIDFVKLAFSHPLLKNAILVDLLGGEPLLCNDIIEIVAFLSSRGYLINTSTNGLLLADKVERLKEAGITRINVSIYPENINILKNTLKSINDVFLVHTSYVLTRSQLEKNTQEILEVIEMSRSSGCKSHRFWMFRPQGKNPNFNELVTEDLPAYRSLKLQVENNYKNYVLWPAVISSPKKITGGGKCRQLWQITSIGVDGKIGVCCGNIPPLSGVNIFTSTLDEIYNHPFVVELRKKLLDKSLIVPSICQTCNLLNETGW
jgi:MoaA/NifB/PqqE/SkfB family radical SAM enzyme